MKMEKQGTAGFWLSPQQKYVWSLQLQGVEMPYRSTCLVSINGPVQPDKLRLALRDVVSRHEMLRTVFQREPGMKVPFQVILEACEPAWTTVDLNALDEGRQQTRFNELLHQEQGRSFNFDQGPLLHASLLDFGRDHFTLVLSLPALCCDVQSLSILVREIGESYADQRKEPEEDQLRYVQFAQWQNDLLESSDEPALEGKKFWSKKGLSEIPVLTLPLEAKRNDATGLQPKLLNRTLEPATLKKIELIASQHDASAADFLLSCWQSLFWRLTGQSNFFSAVAFDGREYEELQDAVGLFAKNLPIPGRFDGDFRFREILGQVRDSIRQASEWQEHFVPRESGPSVGFAYSELPANQAYGNVEFNLVRQDVCSDRFTLKLSAFRSASGLSLEFEYDRARLRSDAVERWA